MEALLIPGKCVSVQRGQYEILGNVVFDFWRGLFDWCGDFARQLGRGPGRGRAHMGGLENPPEEEGQMNTGVVLVAVIGAIFAAYVFLGIRKGSIR